MIKINDAAALVFVILLLVCIIAYLRAARSKDHKTPEKKPGKSRAMSG